MESEYQKGPKSWRLIMEGEQGISRLHALVIERLKDFSLPKKLVCEADAMLNSCYSTETAAITELPESLPGLKVVHALEYQGYTFEGDEDQQSLDIGVLNDPVSLMGKKYLRTAGVMRFVIGLLLKRPEFNVWNYENIEGEQKRAYQATDVWGPKNVVIDNVSTILDVAMVSVNNANGDDPYESLLKMSQSEYGEVGVLESCARAPFGFWASTRRGIPVKFNDQPIFDSQGIYTQDFLKLLRVGKLQIDFVRGRHGGCPALYRDFRSDNTINGFMAIFLNFHNQL